MIRKKYGLLITLIISISSFLHADLASFENSENDCCDSQPSCCEESSGHFFVRGDVLYWKPHVSGLELDFGTSFISETTTDGLEVFNTDEFNIDPHFKWDTGYRVAAGYQFGSNCLEIDAFWTHFQGKGRRNAKEDVDTLNTGRCRLKLDQIDVVLAYSSSMSPSLNLKPFIGVRATRIHEKVNALLVTDITLSTTSFATATRTYDDSQNFHGAGPLLGLHANWDIGCGFGVYGTAAGSVLYGVYKVHFDDAEIFSAPLSKEIFSTNKRDLHEFNCNIDLALGIRWQTCIYDSFQLSMKLGFEHHQYFNQSHLGTNRGDVSFDGGIFSISIGL